jgi:phage shock protein PspC (stress-responsive transcriptional regulator)
MNVIGRMMSVNDCEEADVMSMADRPAGQPERPGSRRLTRSRTDRKIAGVCGGFAAYSGIDANIVRLVMVLLAVLGGSGVVLYLVAWVIVPAEGAGEAAGNGRQ